MLVALVLAATAQEPTAPTSDGAFSRAVALIDELFLDPALVKPRPLFEAAAQELEDQIPWLLVDPRPDGLALAHGADPPFAVLPWPTMDTLPDALADLSRAVETAGFPVEIDVALAALVGTAEALDPHSRVLADERLDRFQVRLSGTFVGVGASFDRQGDALVVTAVNPGGPADTAGLEIADVLLQIDGRSTTGMPTSEVSRRVRGEAGTPVVLHVRRGPETRDVTPIRAEVVVPNVTHKALGDGVGYVAIDHVSQRTVANLVEALGALREAGALERGLVIDLRGNTGGSMKESAAAADLFVDSGDLLRTVGRDGGPVANLQAHMAARDNGNEIDVPVAIVVDDRTASGAEILAGALVELDRAVLVGRRTYGKGTVQKIYDLDPGVQLKLTVARYLLAHDRTLTQGGLVPDVAVVRAYDLGTHLKCFGEPPPGIPGDEVIWQVRGGTDLALELARRAVATSTAPTREATLASLHAAADEIRVAERDTWAAALADRGLDWDAAARPVEGWLAGDVALTATPVDEDAGSVGNRWHLEVAATNEGRSPIRRSVVEIGSETASWWNGLRLPLGEIAAGATARTSLDVEVEPGVWPRLDEVTVRLHADGHPALLFVGRTLPSAGSDPVTLRLEARLGPPTGEPGPGGGEIREVAVVVQNLDRVGLDGVELHLGFPATDAVDLLDQGLHLGRLDGRATLEGKLQVEVREGAPAELPLEVSVSAVGPGELLEWPLALPLDGAPVALQAPRITRPTVPTHVPAGVLAIPLEIGDDGPLAAVTVALDGDKIAWAGGTTATAESLAPVVTLSPGRHVVRITAVDAQHLTTVRTLVLRADDRAATADGAE